jgi:HEAT repeat protein
MTDADATVRLAAVHAWLAIRQQSGAQPVAALLGDADVTVRRAAVAVVGHFAEAGARAELEATLAGDADAAVRRNAAWALGRIGDTASRPALEAALGDSSGIVRGVARAALAELR